MGNGNDSNCRGVVRISIHAQEKQKLETPFVYSLRRSVSCVLPCMVYDGFELMCS